ncbi:MAG TPA: Rrf2 family transcriptional regulator [Gemmataceae bacterium]|nr:Rrf2 family transcriptional regulator [Gemmataceae bacterium]
MKISAQEEYGLRCLLRLARVEAEQPPLTIPEIATSEGLTAPNVAKLLSVLRRAGLIDSVRGCTGGYRLAHPPTEVRLGAVLLALGEPLFDGEYCGRHAGPDSEGPCVHHDGCTLRALWGTLEGWIRRTLNQITLADLLESEGRIADLLRDRLRTEVFEPEETLITLQLASGGRQPPDAVTAPASV